MPRWWVNILWGRKRHGDLEGTPPANHTPPTKQESLGGSNRREREKRKKWGERPPHTPEIRSVAALDMSGGKRRKKKRKKKRRSSKVPRQKRAKKKVRGKREILRGQGRSSRTSPTWPSRSTEVAYIATSKGGEAGGRGRRGIPNPFSSSRRRRKLDKTMQCPRPLSLTMCQKRESGKPKPNIWRGTEHVGGKRQRGQK